MDPHHFSKIDYESRPACRDGKGYDIEVKSSKEEQARNQQILDAERFIPHGPLREGGHSYPLQWLGLVQGSRIGGEKAR